MLLRYAALEGCLTSTEKYKLITFFSKHGLLCVLHAFSTKLTHFSISSNGSRSQKRHWKSFCICFCFPVSNQSCTQPTMHALLLSALSFFMQHFSVISADIPSVSSALRTVWRTYATIPRHFSAAPVGYP